MVKRGASLIKSIISPIALSIIVLFPLGYGNCHAIECGHFVMDLDFSELFKGGESLDGEVVRVDVFVLPFYLGDELIVSIAPRFLEQGKEVCGVFGKYDGIFVDLRGSKLKLDDLHNIARKGGWLYEATIVGTFDDNKISSSFEGGVIFEWSGSMKEVELFELTGRSCRIN